MTKDGDEWEFDDPLDPDSASPYEDGYPGGSSGEDGSPEPRTGDSDSRAVQAAGKAGSKLGGGINSAVGGTAWLIARIINEFVMVFWRFAVYAPLGKRIKDRFWGWCMKLVHKGYYKASGADALCYVYREGMVTPEPVQWQGAVDGEPPRWVTRGTKDAWVATTGADVARGPGNVPVIQASEDGIRIGSELQARTAEVVDLGQTYALLDGVDMTAHLNVPDAGSAGNAVADGGQNMDFTIDKYGALQDYVVDLSNPDPDSDGMVLSWEKYVELEQEKVGSEEMENQEFRGRLAEKDPSEQLAWALKFALIVMGGLAAVAFIVYGLPAMLSGASGGGGGGSLIPFMVGLGGLI